MKGLDLVEVLPQILLIPHQETLIGCSWLGTVHVQVLFEVLILLSSLFEYTILVLYGFLSIRAVALRVLEDLSLYVFCEVSSTPASSEYDIILG